MNNFVERRRLTDIAPLFFGFALLLLIFNPTLSFASDNDPSKSIFSIDATNEPLKKVIGKISKASGYSIVIKTEIKEIEDAPVSIRLSNVTLNEAIRRILRKYNHYAIWEDTENRLVLYILLNKGPSVSVSGIPRMFEPVTKTTID